MSSLSRICLAAVLIAAGCAASPLPRGEIPTEFFFEYERERPQGDDPAPTYVRIQVDNNGAIDYEVQHIYPKSARKRGEISLPQHDLERLYEELRAADLFGMDDRYTGTDDAYGRESFFLIGEGSKDKQVVAEGVEVAKLENLREVMLSILPVEEILGFPREAFREVVMDKRNGEIFPADHELVETIPEEFQVRYKNYWKALNAGGWPSKRLDPPKELHQR